MPADHDAAYKLLFSSSELVRDLVLGFIPDGWLHSLEVARFGPLSQQMLSALDAASTAQLEAWTDRFLSARTLAEVFEAPTAS